MKNNSKDEPEDNNFSEDDIKKLITDALKINLQEKAKKSAKVNTEIAITSTLKEFLNNFIVIGYDLSGKPVLIKYNKTQLEKDALQGLLVKYIQYLLYEGL